MHGSHGTQVARRPRTGTDQRQSRSAIQAKTAPTDAASAGHHTAGLPRISVSRMQLDDAAAPHWSAGRSSFTATLTGRSRTSQPQAWDW